MQTGRSQPPTSASTHSPRRVKAAEPTADTDTHRKPTAAAGIQQRCRRATAGAPCGSINHRRTFMRPASATARCIIPRASTLQTTALISVSAYLLCSNQLAHNRACHSTTTPQPYLTIATLVPPLQTRDESARVVVRRRAAERERQTLRMLPNARRRAVLPPDRVWSALRIRLRAPT